ncbi:hypothetical protein FGIG_06109 [Fasciola gigantica]|uniref:Tropomyosin n=1 Tax=Fasciola gigantica TaxID=46835 RepID=A0A504Z0V6_FASGI|nr:hypothetical protein FGIG_06109 [Fasciola gigantica]
MEVVKERLAAIRNEENELRDKASKIEEDIRATRIDNDKIQIELQNLQSTEKLLKMKIDLTTERLQKVLSMLSTQEKSASSYEKELESLTAARNNMSDKEADLELQLSDARENSREIQAKYDETLIHLQHIEDEKRKKLAQAELVEKQVEALEKEHSILKQAWDKAETTDFNGEAIDNLEVKLNEVKNRLETVNDAYEKSEREVSRLDRLISGVKQDLHKQQAENDSLRKELDGIFHELQNI